MGKTGYGDGDTKPTLKLDGKKVIVEKSHLSSK